MCSSDLELLRQRINLNTAVGSQKLDDMLTPLARSHHPVIRPGIRTVHDFILNIHLKNLSFHFVWHINAFLCTECKPIKRVNPGLLRNKHFHYISFVMKIRISQPFILFSFFCIAVCYSDIETKTNHIRL